MAEHMRTDLVTDALGMAARNHTLADGCIFHSDTAANTPPPYTPQNSSR
jgi:putative transposase